ncbi:MAG: rRNA maturation RNase YbeY [Eubacteriales bacterium]
MKIILCENDLLPKVSQYCDTIILAAKAAMEEDGVDGTLNILFADADEIRRLNLEFREQDNVTDVLSFPANELDGPICAYTTPPELEIDPETQEIVLGDIAICVERAEEQAEEYGHSLLRELCFLAVHGTCHLMGYDHMQPEDECEMTDKQEKILNRLGIGR